MNDNKTKETYVKPESEIINIEVEQPILSGSDAGGSATDWENGGNWGFPT